MKEVSILLKSYKGNITEENNLVRIVANNTLYKSYNDCDEKTGKLIFIKDKPVKVECELTITKDENRYSIDAWEKTCEIIGGFSTKVNTMEEVLKIISEKLEIYNFQRKVCQQLSLFDFD